MAPTQGTHGNVDRDSVRDIEQRLAKISDPDTTLEIGRAWMKDATAKGLTRDQVSGLVDQQFGGGNTAVGSGR